MDARSARVSGSKLFPTYSPRQGDEVPIDPHKALSGGHYRLTEESFNSSLAHHDGWFTDHIESPPDKDFGPRQLWSLVGSGGLQWHPVPRVHHDILGAGSADDAERCPSARP